MLNKNQSQEVGHNALAVQAGQSVYVTQIGLSYSEVRDVALDVFRANFYELAGEAKETARLRAEEITESYLSKLKKDNPDGLNKANDPDFQYALFTVQKEYARNGDKELGDLLIDLLVERSKQEQRDILQIVLNESLSIAPKLTENQLAALSVIFSFKYTQDFGIGNHDLLGAYLDKHVAPFSGKVVKNAACYQHLAFSGCGTIGFGGVSLEQILGDTYQGQFLNGFDEKEIKEKEISIGCDQRFFLPCLNDKSKVQVKANSKEILYKNFDEHNVTQEDRTKIYQLFEVGKMTSEEIKTKCIELRPYMKSLFEAWSDSSLNSFTLTSVGIAIGHANIKRLVGKFANLSIWIN